MYISRHRNSTFMVTTSSLEQTCTLHHPSANMENVQISWTNTTRNILAKSVVILKIDLDEASEILSSYWNDFLLVNNVTFPYTTDLVRLDDVRIGIEISVPSNSKIFFYFLDEYQSICLNDTYNTVLVKEINIKLPQTESINCLIIPSIIPEEKLKNQPVIYYAYEAPKKFNREEEVLNILKYTDFSLEFPIDENILELSNDEIFRQEEFLSIYEYSLSTVISIISKLEDLPSFITEFLSLGNLQLRNEIYNVIFEKLVLIYSFIWTYNGGILLYSDFNFIFSEIFGICEDEENLDILTTVYNDYLPINIVPLETEIQRRSFIQFFMIKYILSLFPNIINHGTIEENIDTNETIGDTGKSPDIKSDKGIKSPDIIPTDKNISSPDILPTDNTIINNTTNKESMYSLPISFDITSIDRLIDRINTLSKSHGKKQLLLTAFYEKASISEITFDEIGDVYSANCHLVKFSTISSWCKDIALVLDWFSRGDDDSWKMSFFEFVVYVEEFVDDFSLIL